MTRSLTPLRGDWQGFEAEQRGTGSALLRASSLSYHNVRQREVSRLTRTGQRALSASAGSRVLVAPTSEPGGQWGRAGRGQELPKWLSVLLPRACTPHRAPEVTP
ncbi:hypothetical protein SKAU_G00040250 [Synaphobranchus kaupii]|uniref:Uncharacterized protein n=1 Tax=Synaphobranchus kaupii TaxID=118154 RepID=A0A9Q1G293_SYNKA|nr:hypothetical protein SKAU_G00040250 [Synaphobranchus kaupii]